jgi:hypothetical protein
VWFRSFTKVLHAFPIPLGKLFTKFRAQLFGIPGQTSEQACSPAQCCCCSFRTFCVSVYAHAHFQPNRIVSCRRHSHCASQWG